MTQNWPKNDSFSDGATTYGTYLCGWHRLVPWTADAGSGDSIVQAVGNLSSAYFVNGSGHQNINSPARKSAAMNASGSASPVSCFVWRAFEGAAVKARAGIHWAGIGAAPLGVASFRYAMVGVRIAGQTIDESVSGDEQLKLGDGYWLVLRNTASATTAKFMLLRVNAGVTTKLTESALVDISTLRVANGLSISIQAATVGSTVELTCLRSPVGQQAVDGSSEVNVFGAVVVDSDGARLTAAGRAGFGMPKPVAGGATLCSSLEITDTSGPTVALRDEWDRANYLVASSVGPDANGKSGRNLMPWYGSNWGGYAANRLQRDAGFNRVRNRTSQTSVEAPSAIRATHEAFQARKLLVQFTTPGSASVDTVSIELRGYNLHGFAGPLGRCYRAEFSCADGTTFAAALVAYLGGSRTVLATKTLSGLAVATAIALRFDVFNTGGATELDGDPNLVVRTDGNVVSGWTSAGVVGIDILGNGVVVDRRSAAILVGWEQGFRWSRSVANSPDIYFDDWDDVATLPDTPVQDLAVNLVSGETDGVTGTLTVPLSWRVEQRISRPGVRHEYESDHRQTLALGSRERRSWSVQAAGKAKASEVAALIAFHNAHKGVEVPFSWVTDDGDTVTVRFLTPDLETVLADKGLSDFEFELQELFS